MKEVTGDKRENFLFNKLGKAFMVFENNLFTRADHWDENYNGGYWRFYETEATETNSQAWFIALDTDEVMTAQTYCTDALTWSVALNLTMFSILSFHYDEKGDENTSQVFAQAYHALREAAFDRLIPNLDVEMFCKIID